MGIKSLKEIWQLFKELAEFKRKIPEIKILFKEFDKSENPKATLEKILETVKKNPVLDDLLKISQTYDMVLRAEKNAEKKGWNYACLEAIKEMGVKVEIKGKENILTNGPTLYISNHPYGLLDSAVLIGSLGSLLEKNGGKMKIIGMNQLRAIKGIEEVIYFVNSTSSASNLKSLKDSLEYLENGGNLAIYPSGTPSGSGLKEYPWKNGIKHFLSSSSYVVPMWVSGPDHERIYNLLARHEKTEKLRRVFSFREAWNKSGKTIYLNIGNPLPSEWLMYEFKDGNERTEYLRRCAENLKVER